MNRLRRTAAIALAASALLAPATSFAATPAPAIPSNLSYSDLTDLALAAQVAVIVTLTDATRLKDADAAGVPPGMVRFYLSGTVDTLIVGKAGLPARIDWLADVPLVANRPPKLKKRREILLARPIVGKPGTLQLVARAGQIDWSAETEQRLRTVLTQALGRDAPPTITGIGHAFHVPGSIPGEGETQMFLKTADNRPVSLSILRRPGEAPRWSVSLSEMVSDSAEAPQRDTLLWYRLACGLPATLPDDSVSDQAPEDAAVAREDYQFVLKALGPCGRTLGADQAH